MQATLFFSISQNPVTTSGSFFITSKEAADGMITVYDMQGKTVMKKKVQMTPGVNTVPVDFSIFPAGHYNAILHSFDDLVKARFVKN